MKNRRTFLGFLLLCALIGGLAWEFWPVANSAPTANPPTAKPAAPKIADALKPTPTHVATIEAPKIAPAPAHDAPEAPKIAPVKPGDPPTSTPPLLPSPPVDPTAVSDLGEVYFTSGVPQQLTLNNGIPVTITATPGANGYMKLRVEFKYVTPNGIDASTVMMSGANAGETLTLPGQPGISPIKLTPRLN